MPQRSLLFGGGGCVWVFPSGGGFSASRPYCIRNVSPTARFSQQLEKWAAGNSNMKRLKKAGHGRASSVACFDILRLFVGIVIEVALNIDDRGTLVAGAAGQVAQGADKIRQVPGGRTLGHHVAH